MNEAKLFYFSALQGVFLMEVENALGMPLSEDEMLIQSCVDPNDPGHQQPRDYSHYLYVINSYMIFFILVKNDKKKPPEKETFWKSPV